MTAMYDAVGVSAAAMAARIVLDQHDGGRRCPACTAHGCPEQTAAARVVADDRRRRELARAVPAPW